MEFAFIEKPVVRAKYSDVIDKMLENSDKALRVIVTGDDHEKKAQSFKRALARAAKENCAKLNATVTEDADTSVVVATITKVVNPLDAPSIL